MLRRHRAIQEIGTGVDRLSLEIYPFLERQRPSAAAYNVKAAGRKCRVIAFTRGRLEKGHGSNGEAEDTEQISAAKVP